MESGQVITAMLFLLIGLITAVQPSFAFNLRTWFGRQVMDMKIQPGVRTLQVYRVVGIAFVLIGAAMLYVELR